jgi:hypothetical protein
MQLGIGVRGPACDGNRVDARRCLAGVLRGAGFIKLASHDGTDALGKRDRAFPGDEGALSSTHRLGQYDARTKEIQILPFDAAFKASVEERPAFGVPMTRDSGAATSRMRWRRPSQTRTLLPVFRT